MYICPRKIKMKKKNQSTKNVLKKLISIIIIILLI